LTTAPLFFSRSGCLRLKQRYTGFLAPVVCFTGLSGCGKSTLALEVARRLQERGERAQILDGDAVRATLSRDLNFSRADREEHLRRISFVAGLLARHDVAVLIAAIAPYRSIRSELRRAHENFIEVYVNAPLSICEARDPKGLYRQARAGAILQFTGISDEYEPPLAPDVECRTDLETLEESVARVLERMDRRPV
jgi:adenylylsulfate kinase